MKPTKFHLVKKYLFIGLSLVFGLILIEQKVNAQDTTLLAWFLDLF